MKSHADCEAGLRKCYGNLEALKAYLYEPLWLAEELAELSLSGKGGIMVKIEAFRLYFMLVDCLRQMQNELRELRSPRDDLYAQIIGRA